MQECIRPGEIDDDAVVGYASGERDPRVVAHLRACARCAALAERFTHAESILGHTLFRFDCPPGMNLGEYHLNLLPAPRRAAIEAHLRVCPHCAAELATAAGFLAEPGAPAPRPLHPLGDLQDRLRRVVAQLVTPPRPALALRGAQPAATVYTAEDLTLTLQSLVEPSGQVQLLGLVEHEQEDFAVMTGALARLLSNQTTMDTTIDAAGNFVIGPVPAGRYDLHLSAADRLVIVPALWLGAGFQAT